MAAGNAQPMAADPPSAVTPAAARASSQMAIRKRCSTPCASGPSTYPGATVTPNQMPLRRHSGIQSRFQVGFEKLGLSCDVLGQVFLGGTGTMRTRWNFRPMFLRNLRTWLGPRRSPVS